MDEDALVRVSGVSKKFCKDLKTSLRYGISDLGKVVFGLKNSETLRPQEFWAVEDISFELKRGECLGLLGHNGAGKSTLLKMLNGLIKPDKGRIEMKGRVAALIELGAGFNPVLTGRENIYVNAAVLGLSKKEIEASIESIIDFSEIREFIDMPVQFYSSGMKVRLGFAVAANIKPDVLILDEILAVGDAGFRIKSFNKIAEIIQNAAVIFVSHSMQTISRICNKALYMSHGKCELATYNVSKAIERYLNDFDGEKPNVEFCEGALINSIKLNGGFSDPNKSSYIKYLGDLEIELDITLIKNVPNFYIMFQITDKDMRIVGQYFTNYQYSFFEVKGDRNFITVKFPRLQFIDGEYSISYFISYQSGQMNNYEYLSIYRNFTKFIMQGLNDTLYAAVHLQAEVYHNEQKLIETNSNDN